MERASNLQDEWARLIIDGLASMGVSDVIISPGSRSTPFVCAALEHPTLYCRSILDERSAAHFALGQARATGMPSLLICTSGSAAANYFPAVVEADEARVPVVVLSADRPPELHHCGANQTTDQWHYYGKRARFFANLGEPVGIEQALRAVRRTSMQAVATALGPIPGPVHLNAQAREPLEPQQADDAHAIALKDLCASIRDEGPVLGAVPSPFNVDQEQLEWLAGACRRAERGLIVCGPAPVHQSAARSAIVTLAERTGFPLLAEAASQFRFMKGAPRLVFDSSDALWRSSHARAHLRPDLIIQIGDTPVSKGWSRLMEQDFARQHVLLTEHGWPDPTARACRLLRGAIAHAVNTLADGLAEHETPNVWRQQMLRAQAIVSEIREAVLQDANQTLTEARIAADVAEQLPEGAALVLGNSLPIRQIDTWAAPKEPAIDVFCQRGVSGIDGVVSGAAGVASKRDGPTLLIVGDVSFLHDLNGLQTARELRSPFVIVVVNNGGGRIFEQLPVAASRPNALEFFTTPHEASIAQAASVYGHRTHNVRTVSAYHAAVQEALREPGCTVIDAGVPPRGALEQNGRLWSEVDRRLGQADL